VKISTSVSGLSSQRAITILLRRLKHCGHFHTLQILERTTFRQPHKQTTDESNMSSSAETPNGRPSTPTMVGTTEVSLSLFLTHSSTTNAAEIVTSPVPTVADDDYQSNEDGDSAFGATSNMTETATVDSNIMKFREENGRTYHTYGLSILIQGLPFSYSQALNISGSTDYYGPNDERAREQQDIR
jgi:hypothetical protein